MSANIFRGTAQHVDLNPLDFCLCGHLKTLVCSAAIENEDSLHHGFFYVTVKPVLTSLGTFESVSQSMIRVHECIDSGGGHTENLL